MRRALGPRPTGRVSGALRSADELEDSRLLAYPVLLLVDVYAIGKDVRRDDRLHVMLWTGSMEKCLAHHPYDFLAGQQTPTRRAAVCRRHRHDPVRPHCRAQRPLLPPNTEAQRTLSQNCYRVIPVSSSGTSPQGRRVSINCSCLLSQVSTTLLGIVSMHEIAPRCGIWGRRPRTRASRRASSVTRRPNSHASSQKREHAPPQKGPFNG